MFTKPLTRQPIAIHDLSQDMSTIHRLLVAAAISQRFCATLLRDPGHAVRTGFGGEQFPISEKTLNLLTSINVSTLPDFVQQLDENLSKQLLATGISQANL
ncbi:MAG TPA: hypothetical protein VFY78_11295 [Gammaproteobacteria bacterium]|nr:hypothetical protein [Gammaproteobacteria bacterium]